MLIFFGYSAYLRLVYNHLTFNLFCDIVNWYCDSKFSSNSLLAFHVDSAAYSFHYLFDEGESHAGAAVFCVCSVSEKWRENVVDVFTVYSAAGVGACYCGIFACFFDVNRDFTPGWSVF